MFGGNNNFFVEEINRKHFVHRFFLDVSATKDRRFITINSNSKSTSEVWIVLRFSVWLEVFWSCLAYYPGVHSPSSLLPSSYPSPSPSPSPLPLPSFPSPAFPSPFPLNRMPARKSLIDHQSDAGFSMAETHLLFTAGQRRKWRQWLVCAQTSAAARGGHGVLRGTQRRWVLHHHQCQQAQLQGTQKGRLPHPHYGGMNFQESFERLRDYVDEGETGFRRQSVPLEPSCNWRLRFLQQLFAGSITSQATAIPLAVLARNFLLTDRKTTEQREFTARECYGILDQDFACRRNRCWHAQSLNL